ncbi:MAG: putative porin [Sphingobacteriaceae bacterium]|nr:putative porin [Sphingobacteriaceae bacterium]
MRSIFKIILFCCLVFGFFDAYAQDLKTKIGANKKLEDSLRKVLDGEKDSLVFTSKFVRYTTLSLIKDSTQTLAIDTSLVGIQNFSVLNQPRKPTVGTGVLGLAAMPLLFEPTKTIGFDAGFHALDFYTLNNEDVKFYRARSPFSSLYYVNGGEKEQVLKLIHTQNIKKNWNFGANFNRIGANGFYTHQRGDDLGASIFTWYESKNKRYNLFYDMVFNTLKAQENGSIVKDDIYADNGGQLADKLAESVRLNSAKQLWRKNSILLKQSYFVGRIDTTSTSSSQNILPTNKITHTLTYTKNQYSFKKNEIDLYGTLPLNPDVPDIDTVFTNDSTNVKHLQNEFVYSFFLRAKGNAIIKNELKINAGIRHDFYQYAQYSVARDTSFLYENTSSFQNITLLGSAGYRFSNRVDFNLDLQQIFQGRNAGDFLYEAKSNILLSNKAGRIILGAYVQNKSPEEIYSRYYGNHLRWDLRTQLDRTKTANLSFNYSNDVLKLDASANYYLITDYLYFKQVDSNTITPAQLGGNINLLKISIGKKFNFRGLHLDAYVVYQKTDNENVLRTPEIYTFNSVYTNWTIFKVLKTQVGFDVRYNTAFAAAGYSPAVSQFYNTTSGERFSSKPVVDVWIKAGLKRANLFLKYDYANQGLFSKGYYTVNRYPMPDRLLKFGVTWNFYD